MASMMACAQCNEVGGATKLQRCGGCKRVMYCSKQCQRAAWKGHKASCKAAREDSALTDLKRQILDAEREAKSAAAALKQAKEKACAVAHDAAKARLDAEEAKAEKLKAEDDFDAATASLRDAAIDIPTEQFESAQRASRATEASSTKEEKMPAVPLHVSLKIATDAVIRAGAQWTVEWTASSIDAAKDAASLVSDSDYLGLYLLGETRPDEYDAVEFTDAKLAGSLDFTAPSRPGKYEFRYMVASNNQCAGTSAGVEIVD